MNSAEGIPWGGLLIAGSTILAVFIFVALVHFVACCISAFRDVLREHYVENSWTPAWIDVLGLPAWLAFEIVCFLGSILGAVLLGLIAYQAAREFRDWWHAGSQSGR